MTNLAFCFGIIFLFAARVDLGLSSKETFTHCIGPEDDARATRSLASLPRVAFVDFQS